MPWRGLRKAAQSGWTVKLQLADVPDAQVESTQIPGLSHPAVNAGVINPKRLLNWEGTI